MSTFSAILLAKERRLVGRLRTAGAVNPEQARTLEELGISPGVILRRLRERAVIREADTDRFYLDEPSWEAVRRGRRRAIHVLWVVALVVLFAFMFGRKLFAP
ncbi:MAG: hypothetical protein M3541_12225 [Acidobacteriota bacterium]|nr:hypothetical protein [Acidobacteriota bacterium]MDQ3419526.1 hypothetical protein [Acidobacteriota bacterium]